MNLKAPHTTTRAVATGRLVSVNVSGVREVSYVGGRSVATGIFKEPVAGPVMVRRLNLDGDRQADLKVHGGLDKAVYIYPASHYSAWSEELRRELPYGTFGENLTLDGPLEEDVRVGDLLLIGGAVLKVTQPRSPCYKLGIKMGDQGFLLRFWQAGRSGFYCRVLQEGPVCAGDEATLLRPEGEQPSIASVFAAAAARNA